MSNILVQFPEIQQAINQAGTGSVTIGPPTFKKSTVEFTELVSDSTGIHLQHSGWGSFGNQKTDFANAFKLNMTSFSRMSNWFGTTQAYVTMDIGDGFYYSSNQTINNLGVIGNTNYSNERYLVSFDKNRYFCFGSKIATYKRQVPVLQKNGG